MTVHKFGGSWTEEKLERVRKYLAAYITIFTNNPKAQKLTPIYVDAFAGTGYRTKPPLNAQTPLFPELTEPETDAFLKGSARIALEVEPSFKKYIFIEQDTEFTRELDKLKKLFPNKASSVEIVQQDANAYLKAWCKQMHPLDRAVMFLDPYGMQVDWSLIEVIAKTKAIDLWILFPLGAAVNRLLTKKNLPPTEWAQALTRIFGTEEWQEAFYTKQARPTLFGQEEVLEKEANFTQISRFFVSRLKTIFTKVADNPLPLRNSKNIPLYLLCFAAGNPNGAPTAIKIAQHILKP